MDRKQAVAVLREKGAVVITCNGRSMEPIMFKGDSLHIRQVPLNKFKVGDAAFVKIRRNLQVHKILTIKNGQFEFGNNHGWSNGFVEAKNVYGLCTRVNDRVLISEEELKQR